ncbi:MAG TPA: tetratricopeptide repeat protein [Verrucomicrobiae bacterium]
MPSSPPKAPAQAARPPWLAGALAAGLALVTILTFVDLYRCEFVNLDDLDYVVRNPNVNQGLSWSMVAWAFTHSYSCNWHPLTWLSHALDCQLYGLNPAGHHITNLLLHTLGAIVLFLALRRLTGALWRSALVAALFAVHPLHVESVAWVSERKDVLSGLFFMLTLWAYGHYVEIRNPKSEIREQRAAAPPLQRSPASTLQRPDGLTLQRFNASTPQRLWYSLSFACFALGLMSKPMLVTLPFVLLLLDYWPLHRLEFKDRRTNIKDLLVEKLPFFALAVGSCVVTMLAQGASQVPLASIPITERLANAALACIAYLHQMFWPAGLAPFYPYSKVTPMWDAGVALLWVLGISAVAFAARKSQPSLIAGWLWYLGMLVPVIGIVQVGTQARADRYTYLPSIGIFVGVAWLAAALFSRRYRYRLVAACAAVLAALTVTAHLQARYWRNDLLLFQHTAAVVPDNYVALSQLGMMDLKDGKVDSAMARLTRALELEPQYPLANHHMGVALLRQGKAAAAIPYLLGAAAQPGLKASTFLVLALCYLQTGNLPDAKAALGMAAAEKPGEPDIEVVRASLLVREGKLAEAEEVYHAILRAHPEHPQAQIDFANFLLTQSRPAEAEPWFAAATRTSPGDINVRAGFASALAMQGKFDQAYLQMEQARKLAPSDPMVHFQSGEIFSQARQSRDAIASYGKAIELNPTFAGAMNNLAWILATDPNDQVRNGRRAVELAEKACELTKWEMPLLMGTLAAAYAEAGRFDAAVKTAEKARDKAISTHDEAIAARNEELINLYRSGKPYREAQTPVADPKK